MTTREDIVRFLNDYLHSAETADISHNGLQVQGRARVRKIAFGVSAGLELFKKAHAAGADMIVVHHGLLWGKEQALTGIFGQRIGFLMRHDISLLGYHLPLDKHPQIGHNALLLKELGAQNIRPFGSYHGQDIGFCGEIRPVALASAVRKLERFCGARATLLPFGPKKICTVGAVSGGGWSMIPDASARKLDLFVTGSLDEPAQELCREGALNCAALGHYNSEKPGVWALMKLMQEHFGVQTQFIDIQNPI